MPELVDITGYGVATKKIFCELLKIKFEKTLLYEQSSADMG